MLLGRWNLDNNKARTIEKKIADKERNKKKNCKPDGETTTGLENFSYQAGKGDKNRLPGWYGDDITQKLNKIFNK